MNISRGADNDAHVAMSRREFLRVGTAGAVGWGVVRRGPLAQAADAGARCESVIVLWMQGGVSHLDTFDPKPDAPADIRGPFKAIGTNVPGIQLCEHLPRMARVADKIAFIRSMRHGEGAHECGMSYMLSGRAPLPGIRHPSLGTVISNELGWRDGVPPYVAIPGTSFAAALGHLGHGWLETVHQPLAIAGDPAHESFDQDGSTLPRENVVERLSQVGNAFDPAHRAVEPMRDTMRSARFCAALNLEKEPDKIRDAYGDASLGRKCLLARRLVEAGVRCVTVDEDGWDHHFCAFDSLKRRLPVFDQAVSALIRDLDDRGLLKTTMVLFLTEFGRSPRINGEAGREHWSDVFSVFAAGGGVRGGQVIGASDARGELPLENAVTPGDLARTVCQQIGIGSNKGCAQSSLGQRASLVRGGRIIGEMI